MRKNTWNNIRELNVYLHKWDDECGHCRPLSTVLDNVENRDCKEHDADARINNETASPPPMPRHSSTYAATLHPYTTSTGIGTVYLADVYPILSHLTRRLSACVIHTRYPLLRLANTTLYTVQLRNISEVSPKSLSYIYDIGLPCVGRGLVFRPRRRAGPPGPRVLWDGASARVNGVALSPACVIRGIHLHPIKLSALVLAGSTKNPCHIQTR
eukprot:9475032-Pyramimonas_sp.AAC.2